MLDPPTDTGRRRQDHPSRQPALVTSRSAKPHAFIDGKYDARDPAAAVTREPGHRLRHVWRIEQRLSLQNIHLREDGCDVGEAWLRQIRPEKPHDSRVDDQICRDI